MSLSGLAVLSKADNAFTLLYKSPNHQLGGLFQFHIHFVYDYLVCIFGFMFTNLKIADIDIMIYIIVG